MLLTKLFSTLSNTRFIDMEITFQDNSVSVLFYCEYLWNRIMYEKNWIQSFFLWTLMPRIMKASYNVFVDFVALMNPRIQKILGTELLLFLYLQFPLSNWCIKKLIRQTRKCH